MPEETTVSTTTAGAPGGRASSAPLLGRDAEPTLFELSHPGRRSWSFRTTGIPEVPVDDLVLSNGLYMGVAVVVGGTWLRSACPTGSSPSTWAPTRSVRAP